MVSFPSLLKKVDMFGYEHSIRYKKDSVQTTACGGVVTIVATGFFFFILVFFGREIYEKNDPIVSFGEQQESQGKVPLRAIETFTVFTDGHGTLLNINPQFYTSFEVLALKINLDNSEGSGKVTETNIPLIPCNDELISDDNIANLGLELDKRIGLCLNVPPEEYIIDEFGAINSATYIIRLRLCDETENPGCRAFNDTVTNMQAIIYTKEQFFNPGDYNNPIGTRIFTNQADVSADLKVITTQTIQVNEALTDNNALFSVSDSRIFYSTSSVRNQTKLFSETTRDIYEHRIEATKLKKTFKRRYLKIQELIAFVGGFVKGILTLGAVASKLYGKYYFIRQNITVELVKLTGNRPERNSSVVIRKANQSADELVVEDKTVPRGKMSLWNFLVGQISSSYLKKRNIDYSAVLNKFDVHRINEMIGNLQRKVKTLEESNNQT